MKDSKYTPEELVGILHSISKFELDDRGVLDTYFKDSDLAEGVNSFQYGSFTHQLLCLVEDTLNGR